MKKRKKKEEPLNTYRLDDYRKPRKKTDNTRHNKQAKDAYTAYRQVESRDYAQRLAESARLREELRQTNRKKLSKKELERRKKRLKRRRQVGVAVFICMAITLTYSIVKMIDWFTYPVISYQAVQEGVIDNTIQRNGLIVREEGIVTSEKTGIVHRVIGQGEKVAVGGQVSFVADESETERALEAMNALDEQIYSIQEKRTDFSYYQSDIYEINQTIMEEVENIYETNYWESPSIVYDMRSNLERAIQARTVIYLEDETEFTEDLQQGRKELQPVLDDYQYVETAEQSGIISYVIDGFEGINFESMQSLTYESYTEALKSAEYITLTANTNIASGEALYKIISDDTWKIITYMTHEEAKAFEVGYNYNFYLEGEASRAISFKLERIAEENEYVQLVFSTEDHLQTYLTSRSLNFVIGENREEGLKIPLKAVVEKNMLVLPSEYIIEDGREDGVLQVVGGNTIYTPINIQYTDDTHTYIMQEIDNTDAIQLGDMIQNPSGDVVQAVDQVIAVEGVYVINGAYAKFKQIKIVMTNEDYAILSDDEQTKVKIFDQIISNPQNIQEEQLLKYMEVVND